MAHSQNLENYKVVVLGGGAVGKSALTIRLVTHSFLEAYDPTIEDSYRKQVMVDKQYVLLDILDTAGQEEYSALQDQWMRHGKGFVFVYSIIDKSSFDEVEVLHSKTLRSIDKESLQVPMVLVGNKCDLEMERVVSFDDGHALADRWGCPFFETSAKEEINNETCFFELVREIRKKEKTDKPQIRDRPAWLRRCSIL